MTVPAPGGHHLVAAECENTSKAQQVRLPIDWAATGTYLADANGKSRYRSAHVDSSALAVSWTQRKEHSLHTLVPRLGGFPAGLARWAVQEFSRPGDTVLDPFAGKGTAPLEALLQGRDAVGSDAAPEAFVIAHAKLSRTTHAEAEAFLHRLNLPLSPSIDEVPDDVRQFFSDETLRQILSLRAALFRTLAVGPGNIESLSGQSLSDEKRTALYVLACLLGCLHGPIDWDAHRDDAAKGDCVDRYSSPSRQHKIEELNPESLYLSVHCNHTYSASPGYVRRYCSKHGLVPPERNVVVSVLRKSRLAQEDGVPERGGTALCLQAEALHYRSVADLVVTSPPYFRAQTYAWDNWLRLWLLGYPDHRTVGRRLLHTASIARYAAGIAACLARVKVSLRGNEARAAVVVGDVRTRVKGKHSFLQEDDRHRRYLTHDGAKLLINTSEVVGDVAAALGFRVEQIVDDFIPRGDRALASFLGPKHGTDIDRAVILRLEHSRERTF